MKKIIKSGVVISVIGMAICLFGGCKREQKENMDFYEKQGIYQTETGEKPADTSEMDKTAEEKAAEEKAAEEKIAEEKIDYRTLEATSVIKDELSEEEIDGLFFAEEISIEIFARIDGKSFRENEDIAPEDLRYLHVLYVGFDELTHVGELIVNKYIEEDVLNIFRALYDNAYQIEKMVLIDEYDGDDHASMLDNNTSAFNYRNVDDTASLSKHAYGLAIDINPFYNPYVTYVDGKENISPEGSEPYADRSADFQHKIDENDLCFQLFAEYGFTWGGNWKTMKDYQHFQIKME